jgi:hypothetical protein
MNLSKTGFRDEATVTAMPAEYYVAVSSLGAAAPTSSCSHSSSLETCSALGDVEPHLQ